MAESNGLLNRRTGNNRYRGFESLSLRHFFMRRFWATNAHGPTNWMCNTGSVFEPSARKIFWGGKYAATSCGRIGRNGASGSVFKPCSYRELWASPIDSRGRNDHSLTGQHASFQRQSNSLWLSCSHFITSDFNSVAKLISSSASASEAPPT